jgi:hypothetical protein
MCQPNRETVTRGDRGPNASELGPHPEWNTLSLAGPNPTDVDTGSEFNTESVTQFGKLLWRQSRREKHTGRCSLVGWEKPHIGQWETLLSYPPVTTAPCREVPPADQQGHEAKPQLILTEIEMCSKATTDRVAQKSLATFATKIKAELLIQVFIDLLVTIDFNAFQDILNLLQVVAVCIAYIIQFIDRGVDFHANHVS